MGLIRDAIGSALAGPDINNGLNERKLSLLGPSGSSSHRQMSSSSYQSPRPPRRACSRDCRNQSYRYRQDGQNQQNHYSYNDRPSLDRRQFQAAYQRPNARQNYLAPSPRPKETHRYNDADAPPSYSPYPTDSRASSTIYHEEDRASYTGFFDEYSQRGPYIHPRSNEQSLLGPVSLRRVDVNFRVLALPQIDYADGAPFLRGYSNELQYYGISERVFFEALDAINVARIPNPENQIFQKGANIAGWFVPGAAVIGLVAGQVGVGLASHFGRSSMINRVLSKANLEVFVPNGLEICICKAKDVDAELGLSPYDAHRRCLQGPYPEEKVAAYGDLLAPLTRILPPAEHTGRRDPIAGLGRMLNNRETQRKVKKAQEREGKGRRGGMNQLDDKLQWLMVRPASPGALERWQMTLKQSDEELDQGPAQKRSRSGVQTD